MMVKNNRELMKAAGERCKVPLEDVSIDFSYQREAKSSSRKIAEDFMPQACKDLLIAQRPDGTLWLVDGHQEYLALRQMGFTHWFGRVVASTGSEHEANLFCIVNGGRGTVKQLTSRELFRALLHSGDALATAMVDAIHAGGLELSLHGNSGWPRLTCIKGLYRLAQMHGCDVLTHGCRLVSETWPQDHDAVRDLIPRAVIKIVAVFPNLNDDHFVRQLSKLPARKVIQQAQIIGDRATAAFEIIMREYNKRLRVDSQLPVRLADVG